MTADLTAVPRTDLEDELLKRHYAEDCVDCGHPDEDHDDGHPEEDHDDNGCWHVDDDGDRCDCKHFVGYDSVAKEDYRNGDD